jgi:hypothetical protein
MVLRSFLDLKFHAFAFALLRYAHTFVFLAFWDHTLALMLLSIHIYSKMIAQAGHAEQDKQNRTSRTGHAELDKQNKKGRTGL